VADALALVGLTAFADKRPQQLSGGMRQLVALARVLVMKPQLLLMDEPFAALDALTRLKMQSHLIGIWQKTRITILLITHSVEEAIYLGDEVIVLSGRPGTVQARLPVALERPRDVTSIAFNQIKAEALRHLGIH
jgi:ABC-type nitrate/sulfonate/bicarbonate transport system ATPase subunit